MNSQVHTLSSRSEARTASIGHWLIFMGIGVGLLPHPQAYVRVEPPVPTISQGEKQSSWVRKLITLQNTTAIYSDLRWRDVSLTGQQAGLSSKFVALVDQKYFYTVASTQAYSYSPEKLSQAGTYVDVANTMIESKIGIQLNPLNRISLQLLRGIVMWPGGTVWVNQGSHALTPGQDTKPVKLLEVNLNIHDFELSYNKGERTSTVFTGAPSYEMWNDYFHITHIPYEIGSFYSFDLEYGYWKSTGSHFDFNLYYQFNKTIRGQLKAYNFRGYTDIAPFKDNYGLTGILQFRML